MNHLVIATGALLAQGVEFLAQEADAESSGSIFALLLPLLIVGGLFYFILIMPQRRRVKQMQSLRDSIEVGDEVRTVGGIFGVVRSLDDTEAVIDVGGGTELRVVRRAIAEKLGGEEE